MFGLIELLLILPIVGVFMPWVFVFGWRSWGERSAPAFHGPRVTTLRRTVALLVDLALAALPYRIALMVAYSGDLAFTCLIPPSPSVWPSMSGAIPAIIPGLVYLALRSVWGGRFSLGTRLMGYRVVLAADGRPAGVKASLLRNGTLWAYLAANYWLAFFGIATPSDVTTFFGGVFLVLGGPLIVVVGIAATHASRQGRRLGDLLAGTVAIDG